MSSKAKGTMLKALIKLRVAESFSGFGKRKNRSAAGRSGLSAVIIYALLGVFVMVSLGTTFFAIAMMLKGTGAMELYWPIVMILAFILCFIGSVFMAQHQIFEAKDNDTMFSLPIPPRMILISRILSLILINFYYEAMIAIPGAVAYGVFHGYTVKSFVFFLICSLLVPLLAITCSMILAYLIALVSSKLRNSRIISLVLSVAALGAYMFFITTWTERLQRLAENAADAVVKLKKFIPPAWYYSDAIHGGNALSLLIFALICIVPFAAVCFIISRNFIRIATTQRGMKKIEYRGGAMKASGSFGALVRIEMNRFTGSNVYMLNSALGLIFVVIAAFALLFKKGELQEMITELPAGGIEAFIGPLITVVFLFLAVMVFISSATISLDAYTMWQLKSLPVSGKNVLLAKAVPHILVSLPFFIVGTVIVQFAVPMDPVWRIGVIVLPLIATVHNALLGVAINLKFPKLDWMTEAHAVKQGLAPMLAMLMNAIPVLILIAIYYVFTGPAGLPTWTVLIAAFVLYAVLSVLLYIMLKNWGTRKYAAIPS